jgi:hypothetical protein
MVTNASPIGGEAFLFYAIATLIKGGEMNAARWIGFFLLSLVLAGCAQPPTPTPIPTATAIPPSPTPVPPTATPIPPTATPVPPTATAVPPTATRVPPTATPVPPTATLIPRPSPTSEFPPIPAGMGGLIVTNWYGREINYEIGGKLHKIPPSGGRVIIHLAPGKQNYSADIAGYGRAGGSLEIVLGRYITQQWADR